MSKLVQDLLTERGPELAAAIADSGALVFCCGSRPFREDARRILLAALKGFLSLRDAGGAIGAHGALERAWREDAWDG